MNTTAGYLQCLIYMHTQRPSQKWTYNSFSSVCNNTSQFCMNTRKPRSIDMKLCTAAPFIQSIYQYSHEFNTIRSIRLFLELDILVALAMAMDSITRKCLSICSATKVNKSKQTEVLVRKQLNALKELELMSYAHIKSEDKYVFRLCVKYPCGDDDSLFTVLQY